MSDSNNNKRNSCTQTPCQTRQVERGPDLSSEDEMKGRLVLYSGVVWIGILRNFLVPRERGESESLEATGAPLRPNHVSSRRQESNEPSPLFHPNRPPVDTDGEQLRRREKKDAKHSTLASLAYQLQDVSAVLAGEARQLSDEFSELVQDSKATTSEAINSLRKENAVVQRYGAITTGGLVGYLSGWRRGIITKLVYSVTGAVAIASIFYPEEARHYNSQGLEAVRRAIERLRPGPDKIFGFGDKTPSKETSNEEKNSSSQISNLISKHLNKNVSPLADNQNMLPKENHHSPKDHIQIQHGLEQDFDKTSTKHKVLSESDHAKCIGKKEDIIEDPQYVHKGKLVKECLDDAIKVMPYSPALSESSKVYYSPEQLGTPKETYFTEQSTSQKRPCYTEQSVPPAFSYSHELPAPPNVPYFSEQSAPDKGANLPKQFAPQKVPCSSEQPAPQKVPCSSQQPAPHKFPCSPEQSVPKKVPYSPEQPARPETIYSPEQPMTPKVSYSPEQPAAPKVACSPDQDVSQKGTSYADSSALTKVPFSPALPVPPKVLYSSKKPAPQKGTYSSEHIAPSKSSYAPVAPSPDSTCHSPRANRSYRTHNQTVTNKTTSKESVNPSQYEARRKQSSATKPVKQTNMDPAPKSLNIMQDPPQSGSSPYHPLNKKLSRYYVERKDKSGDLLTTTNDDLHSNKEHRPT